jgi:CHAT domain-containing protein
MTLRRFGEAWSRSVKDGHRVGSQPLQEMCAETHAVARGTWSLVHSTAIVQIAGSFALVLCLASSASAQQIPQPPAARPLEARYATLAAQLVQAGDDAARDGLLAAQAKPADAALVAALNQAGDEFALKHDYPPARRAYAIACGIAGRTGDAHGEFLCRVGAANCSLGEARYDEALAAYENLRAEAAARGDHAAMARVLHGMGLAHRSRSEHPEALALYDQALAEAALAGDEEQTAQIEMHVGNLLYFLTRYREATTALDRALEIARRRGLDRDTINILTSLGGLWYGQKDYAVALKYEHEALALIEKTGISDSLNTVYGHLALENASIGRHDQSIQYYELSLKTVPEANRYARMMVLHNYSAELRSAGRFAEALEKLQQGLDLALQIERREMIPHFRVSLAEVAVLRSQWPEAAGYAEEAIEAARGYSEPFLLIRAYDALGVARFHQKRYQESEKALEAGIEAIAVLRAELPASPETLALFMRDKISVYSHLMETLLAAGRTADALACAERAKARVLVELLAGGKADLSRTLAPEEKQKEDALRKKVADLRQQILEESRKSRPDQARLAALNRSLENARLEVRNFENVLYSGHEELKLRRAEIAPATPAELMARLPDRETALAEYAATDHGMALFVATREASRWYTLKVDPERLAKDVAQFREQVAGRDVTYRGLARKLYAALVAPAAAQMAGKRTLVIVPDGPLWKLPFQALETPAGKFLIEERAVFYAPSLTALNETLGGRRPAGAPRALVLLGPASADVEAEAAGLREIYGAARTTVYSGSEATAARLGSEAAGYQVLHLATHGVFQDRSPMLSYLLLAETRALDAREMMDLPLRASVVVLAACETGRGEAVNGEGLLGMTWALLVAGSPATVASQWKVESRSTTDLMLAFHRRMKDGAAKAEALRQAELAVMRSGEYRHPFYWAGFELVGNGF